jgi:hypothetical protein
LDAGLLDLRYNMLYTNDSALDAFLDSKQSGGDWSATQTIAPGNVQVAGVTQSSVALTWDAIEYTSGTGRYRVAYGTTPGGPYPDQAGTASKSQTSLTINGLMPTTDYYFVVRSETDRTGGDLASDYGPEVMATTLESRTISGTVTAEGSGSPLANVTVCVMNTSTFYQICGPDFDVTDENGDYSVEGLMPTNGYRLYTPDLGGQPYSPEVYDNLPVYSPYNGTDIDLTDADAVIDIQLARSGLISGRVTDSVTGEPAPNVPIFAYNEGCSSGSWSFTTPYLSSDASGYYAMSGVPDGAWYVSVEDNNDSYVNEVYPDQHYIGSACFDRPEGSRPVVIENKTEAGGIDFSLDMGGTIRSRVTSSVGRRDVVRRLPGMFRLARPLCLGHQGCSPRQLPRGADQQLVWSLWRPRPRPGRPALPGRAVPEKFLSLEPGHGDFHRRGRGGRRHRRRAGARCAAARANHRCGHR